MAMVDGLCTSVPVAVLACLALTALYVGCLYVFSAHHERNGRRAPDRDDPQVVRERFVRVGFACLLSPLITIAAAALPVGPTPCEPSMPLARWFGLATDSPTTLLLATFVPLALTAALFIGPLFADFFVDRAYRTSVRDFLRTADVRLVRNLVVGPLTEEWVFRACMCPLLRGAGLGDATCVFTAGAIFGLAHVHHVFDAGAPWMAVAVQFTYTSLFGAYSSYLFLRTGLIYGAVAAHAFCNAMGLPDFGRAFRERPVGAAFVVGLGSFTVLTTLDALYRPRIFHSPLWAEA